MKHGAVDSKQVVQHIVWQMLEGKLHCSAKSIGGWPRLALFVPRVCWCLHCCVVTGVEPSCARWECTY